MSPRADVVVRGLVLAMTLAATTTHAQEAPPDPAQRAAELAHRALARYEAGSPEEAIPLLLEAHGLYPEPLLTYNLARAYEALGRRREALEAYRRYVAERPDAPDRAAMQTHIASLEAQLEERRRLAREREEERRGRELAEARAADARRIAPWSYLLLSGGGAVLGAGVVFGVLARAERNAAGDEPIHSIRVRRGEDAERRATVANVLFAVGGALSLVGASWLTVELVRRGRDVNATPLSLSIRVGGLSLEGSF